MKMIAVAMLALVVVAAAAPQGSPAQAAAAARGAAAPEPVKILRSEFEQQPDGAYTFDFETEDGVQRQENGELKEVVDEENKPHSVVVVKGSYSYPGEDGKPVVVSYYADETGYHAEGDSIPKAA